MVRWDKLYNINWPEKSKIRNILDSIFKVEIIFFIVIFIVAVLYYNYDSAHEYFNRSNHSLPWYTAKIMISELATYVFVISFFTVFIFPYVFLIELVACIWARMINLKTILKLIAIVLLYFACMISVLLFYSIEKKDSVNQIFIKQKRLLLTLITNKYVCNTRYSLIKVPSFINRKKFVWELKLSYFCFRIILNN